MMNYSRCTSGFTLVEVMVSTAIIAILATAGFAAFSEMRAKARDTRRIEDLQSIAKVFALHMVETGQVFDCERGVVIEPGMRELHGTGNCADIAEIEALLVQYLGEVPTDPLGAGHERYFYYYDRHACGGGESGKFILYAAMENETNSNREAVCPAREVTAGNPKGTNNDGFYNYNTVLGVENFPYVVQIN